MTGTWREIYRSSNFKDSTFQNAHKLTEQEFSTWQIILGFVFFFFFAKGAESVKYEKLDP